MSKFLSILTVGLIACVCQAILPPIITVQPTDGDEDPNHIIYKSSFEPLVLNCEAKGEDVEFSWKFNEDDLDTNQPNGWKFINSESGSIRVEEPMSNQHDGWYQCIAKVGDFAAKSEVVFVQKADLDYSSSTDIKEERSNVGDPIKISCRKALSIPPPQYSWRVANSVAAVETTQVVENNRIRIDNDGNLYFSYLRKTDEQILSGVHQIYKCDVRNAVLDQNAGGSYTKLFVNGNDNNIPPRSPVELFEIPEEQVALRGDDLMLRCFFSGYPAVNINWNRVDASLDRTRLKVRDSDSTFIYEDIRDDDEGQYKCEGISGADSSEKVFNVKVEARPTFLAKADSPYNRNATEGDGLRIICNADGIPKPTVVWYINGKEVDEDDANLRRKFSEDNTELIMQNVCETCSDDTTDIMVIACNASNMHGFSFSQGYLNILDKTVIIKSPENVTLTQAMVNDGEDVKLVCDVITDATTPATVKWERDGFVVNDRDKLFDIIDNNLIIHLGHLEDKDGVLGEYTCVASNGPTDEGYSMATASATVSAAVPIIPVVPVPQPQKSSFPWWIIIVIIVVILFIVLLLLCIYYCCCHQGAYKLREDKEDLERALNDSDFHDYARPEDLDGIKKPDTLSQSTVSLDERSLDEYGELDVGKFNEDGSFINEYDNPGVRSNTNNTFV